jgi:hypothetical protein
VVGDRARLELCGTLHSRDLLMSVSDSLCQEASLMVQTRGQQRAFTISVNTSAGGDENVTDSPRKRLIRSVIPDFKGHHFVEDSKPGEPPSFHHCERCGMKALLRPNGSAYFDVDGTVLRTNPDVPLSASSIPNCK